MSQVINIQVEPSKEELVISGYPEGIAFNVTPLNNEYVLEQPQTKEISANTGLLDYDFTVNANQPVEAINAAGSVNITLGTLPENYLFEQKNTFKHSYQNFIDPNFGTIANPVVSGKVVMFLADNSATANDWKSLCLYADTSNIVNGAYNSLFIVHSYENNNLVLISQGYFDLPDTLVNQWTPGRTLYLNGNNIFSTIPDSILSDGWVRSVGYCVPNTQNKNRIWFQPDSTYIKVI